jgi:hypothetical protein
MADYVEQTDAFTVTTPGTWVSTSQGAQVRVTLPTGPVSGPFQVVIEATGGTADSHFFFGLLWDGFPVEAFRQVFLTHDGADPTKSSLTFALDPFVPDHGPGSHTLAVNLRRQFPDHYADELFGRFAVVVQEPVPRRRPRYTGVYNTGGVVRVGLLVPAAGGSAPGPRARPVRLYVQPASSSPQQGVRLFATPTRLAGLPHLDRRGGVRSTYDPVYSIFPRFLVDARPDELASNPALAPALKAAAVNTILTGFMRLPSEVSGYATLAEAVAFATSWANGFLRPCRDNGFAVMLSSDEWDRGPADEALTQQTTPWSMADYGAAVLDNALAYNPVAVWGPDEADDVLSQYAGNGYRSRVTLHALTAACSLPMILPGKAMDVLEATSFCDALGRYHDNREGSYGGPRGYYPAGTWLRWMRERLDGGTLVKAPDPVKPLVVQVQCDYCGYNKNSPGADPNPVAGDTFYVITDPNYVTMQGGFALTRGACGFFLYGMDSAFARSLRQGYPVPTPNVEYRPDPFGVNAPAAGHWTALSVMNNAVADWEARLLSAPADAWSFGPGFATLARDGGPGRKIWLAVNLTDTPRASAAGTPPGFWDDGWVVGATARTRVAPGALADSTIPAGGWAVLTG